MRTRPGPAALIAASLLLVASCGTQNSSDPTESGVAADSGGGTPEASPPSVISAWAVVTYDYSVASGPGELESLAALAGRGVIGDVGPGGVDGDVGLDPEQFPSPPLAAIEIKPDEIVKGDATGTESIWLEVLADPEKVKASVPEGLGVVFYLTRVPEPGVGATYDSEGSIIPENAPRWQTAHPEGLSFSISGDDQGVIVPIPGDVDYDQELDSQLP